MLIYKSSKRSSKLSKYCLSEYFPDIDWWKRSECQRHRRILVANFGILSSREEASTSPQFQSRGYEFVGNLQIYVNRWSIVFVSFLSKLPVWCIYEQIRVSSKISNGPVILNVDCDMYSNNPQSVRDALCFFMDEEKGHEIAFVQFPQNFGNVTTNEIYGASLRILRNVST